jgi:anion transporter
MSATASVVAQVSTGKEEHSIKALVGAALGPLLAVAIWFSPLGLVPLQQHALAIVAFMVVYWITEPIDHGLTALTGCFLFWALHIAKFESAFSGFADSTPWFLYGGMLMGEAAARSGLARRIGFLVIRLIGTSYERLLLSVIVLSLVLNFLVPNGMAQVAIVAPILIGIVAAFGVDRLSNIGRGLFVILTYTCGLFNKMILAGGNSILTRGMVEKLTGKTIYWTQFFVAYLPASLFTIMASWFIITRLYPPERKQLPGGREYIQNALDSMGPWTTAEFKALAWLLLAIGLWGTDMLHHINPAVVALGVGLALTLPMIGVLSLKDVRQMNLLLIVFLAGALSMGQVLIETKAIGVLANGMMSWMAPFLGSAFGAANVLYWTGFVYHFVLGSELSMLSTSLPAIISYATTHGLNPVPIAMIWSFAAGGKIFVYQSSVLMLGYAYGYFETKDLIKVGILLTIVEGVILALIVPLYWPWIGLPWRP